MELQEPWVHGLTGAIKAYWCTQSPEKSLLLDEGCAKLFFEISPGQAVSDVKFDPSSPFLSPYSVPLNWMGRSVFAAQHLQYCPRKGSDVRRSYFTA